MCKYRISIYTTYKIATPLLKEISSTFNSYHSSNKLIRNDGETYNYADLKTAKRDFNRVSRLYKDKGAIKTLEKGCPTEGFDGIPQIQHEEVWIRLLNY